MTVDQTALFAILLAALALFIWGKWRYDVVAIGALLAAVFAGVVPAENAFSGFGHPAVITVAAVLIITRALRNSAIPDLLVTCMSPFAGHTTLQIAALTILVAIFSSFMNNVGALALMMPIALQIANKTGLPSSVVLMPLSFGSLLGGLMTMIGTPPNIIIANYRTEYGGVPFAMFDFAPVGIGVAIVGICFIVLVGWRLLPQRKGAVHTDTAFEQIEDYITEARLEPDSEFVGATLQELEAIGQEDVAIVGLIRGERKLLAPSSFLRLQEGDILILEGDPDALRTLVDQAKLELIGSEGLSMETIRSDDVSLMEAVIPPGSAMESQTSRNLRLHARLGINMLGVARHGIPVKERLSRIRFQAGDVLLLQGETTALAEAMSELGCLPLARRDIRLGKKQRTLLPVGIFATAIALTAFGVLPAAVAFMGAVLAIVLFDLLSLREAYESIEWPIIVLLAAMIPVGMALRETGGTDLIGGIFVGASNYLDPPIILALVMIVTMLLSDVMNNAATAVLMAPIAASVAMGLGVNIDPFLMAVAVGASSTFLTPIGHQSNTLVMGPGGYKFGDYWRMGLPLDILIIAVSVPLILYCWPL
ncbi:MAG: SLC13 family permease [Rhodospirillaceae bacterium]|nr:MAG: SLC13 family permease [Rhodospirillaceae bacterium]